MVISVFQTIVQKGVGANLLKVGSKRRRTKNEIEEEKQEEIMKQQKLQQDMEELASLRARVQDAEHRAVENVGASKLLHHMLDAGHVKQDGDG